MPLPLIMLGIGAAAAGAGAIGSAYNTNKARKEEARSYQQSKNFLNSQYYRDPLSTVGNRSLLKSLDQRMKDSTEALENRAAAGGATMENQLAARQANNEVMGNVYSNLLQGEDARRDRIAAQQLALDQQHSINLQNGYLQNAQNWQQWGSQMGNAAMSFGGSLMEGYAKGMDTRQMLGLPKKD